jgi:hypothetical protein
VRVADFCRENMLDYYEMVEALKQEKLEVESYERLLNSFVHSQWHKHARTA